MNLKNTFIKSGFSIYADVYSTLRLVYSRRRTTSDTGPD